jgi:hypothetical protein
MQLFSTYLNDYIDWTEDEISLRKKYLDWNELKKKFEDIELTWDEIFILLEVRGGGGSKREESDLLRKYVEGNPWNKLRQDFGQEKTDRIVKIFCKVHGINYEKVLESKKDIRISINEFERFIEQVVVKVDVK